MRTGRMRRYLEGHFEKQKGKCCFCKTTLVLTTSEDDQTLPNRATVEHIIPKMQQGKTTWDNTAASCNRCNLYRGPIPFSLFKKERLWLREKNKERRTLITQIIRG